MQLITCLLGSLHIEAGGAPHCRLHAALTLSQGDKTQAVALCHHRLCSSPSTHSDAGIPDAPFNMLAVHGCMLQYLWAPVLSSLLPWQASSQMHVS